MIGRHAGRQAVLNFYWIPLNLQTTALMAIAVPAALLQYPGDHTRLLALLATLVAFMAMIVPPFAGALSDRLRRGGATRKPLIVGGAALNAAALIWMMQHGSIETFTAALLLGVLGQSISLAAYQALIPEVVSRDDWGLASGFQGAASLIGSVAGLALASLTDPARTFLGSALVLILGVAAVLWTPEGRWHADDGEHARIGNWYDFIVAFWSRSWTILGLSLLMTFVLYFFRDVLKYSNPSAGTGIVGGMALVGAIVSSVAMGILSDRVKRKYVVALAGIPMTLAAVGFALFPNVQWIMAFALLFGLGYGAFVSTGWALAIDSVPQLRDVARDLGVWGIASNLPAVVAPAAGGWLLAQFAVPVIGYKALFIAAGMSFALGSIFVLAVGERKRFGICFQFVALGLAMLYFRLAYRIRHYGRLPRDRGPTLVLCNHQHDLDTTAVIAQLIIDGPWYEPIYAAGSRRMFEPGFMGARTRWLRKVLRSANWAGLFSALGCLPIENELRTRTIAALAAAIERRHGDLLLGDVFQGSALVALGEGAAELRVSDLGDPSLYSVGRDVLARIEDVRAPYRDEIVAQTRADLEADLQRIEQTMRRGVTFFLTPEGRYSRDGRLSRLRTTLWRLKPLATVYLSSVSYDPFVGRRLSVLFRIARPAADDDLASSMAAARPITTSQLIAAWLADVPSDMSLESAIRDVRVRLQTVPTGAFVDPELSQAPDRMVRAAFAGLTRLGILEPSQASVVGQASLAQRDETYALTGVRTHPQFPLAPDILAHQANQFAETIAALQTLDNRREAGEVSRRAATHVLPIVREGS
ncbi:MAG TPA: MFS transporter [Candidatus Eremiobacteraceae bacterium]|nr:MFS transporter [Candidatus Eremiobacteraceae bacterium]